MPLHLDLGLKGCAEKNPAVRKFITAIKEQPVKFRKCYEPVDVGESICEGTADISQDQKENSQGK